MIRASIIVILYILLTTLSAFGADWAVSWIDTDGKNHYKKIADEQEYQFAMARFSCKVSKNTLDKTYDEVYERRYLSCMVSRGTSVSVDLAYNVRSTDYREARSLYIHDGSKTLTTTLYVHQP